ncbi:questin oxidase family protein [Nocardia callitridis]|uniref:Questin oxidase family protein n=1 Tax=Nocardia callitridis TaxID=648753 RepID=A0ABP9L585_9NOCA
MPTTVVAHVSDLLGDRTHHIEFNGHLTNHVKHAVVALAGIGAPEQVIRDYYKSYCTLTPYGFPVEPQRTSSVSIEEDNWREFLGKRAHFSAYTRFFDEQIAHLGSRGAVAKYAPELLRGWIGAFTHATIHLGWAIWSDHPAMTAEALAYLAFSFVPVHLEDAERGQTTDPEPLSTLRRLSDAWSKDQAFHDRVEAVITDTNSVTELHPELNRSGLQARVASIAHSGIPDLTARPAWIAGADAAASRRALRRAVTLLYLASPGDFVVLHLITSLFALEVIADTLDDPTAENTVYDLFATGLRVIVAAERKIPTTAKLEELDSLFGNAEADRSPFAAAEFDVTARRAWLEDEEHNPKLVFVLRAWWNEDRWPAYRHAAAQFTRTPDLPPSFEEPPNE